MPLSLALRTRCEKCKDPLPINAFSTKVRCVSCLHDNPLSAEQWGELLRQPLEDAWTMEEGETRTETRKVGKRSFELTYGLPRKVKGKSRPRPKEMRADLFPSVVALTGEHEAAPGREQNVPFTCPQCGGSLSLDGKSRDVTCPYCHTATGLSDDIWRKLHPEQAQKTWFLVLQDDEGAPKGDEKAAAKEAPMSASISVEDALVGPDGKIYIAGEIGGKEGVACLDADLDLQWRTDAKREIPGYGKVALLGDEVWFADVCKHVARVYARDGGQPRGKKGGVEPEGATVHHLDLHGACELIGMPDGTLLVCTCHRLVRYDKDGKGIPTWPASGGIFSWFSKAPVESLFESPPEEDDDGPVSARTARGWTAIADHFGQNKPTRMLTLHTRGVAGRDGSLWLCDGNRVARYAPDGTCRWCATLEGVESYMGVRPGLDGDGNVYVIANRKGDAAQLWKVDGNGRVTVHIGAGLGTPSALAVLPDGRLAVFGYNTGEVRRFDRDGKLLGASAAAVDADQNAAENAGDEDEDEE